MLRERVLLDMTYCVPSDIDEIVDRFWGDRKAFAGAAVLISGGCGFLGRYLVAALKRLDAACVVAIDSLVTRDPFGIAMKDDPAYLAWDVCDPVPKNRLPATVTHVVHAAGIASPHYYRKFPMTTLDVAVKGTRNMLDLALERKARFLFMSSSEIYGDPDPKHVPTPETYRGNVATLGPRSVYDEGKRFGETLCHVYHCSLGVPAVIVRPFNIYGPGMSETDYRAMPNFASRLKAGKPLQVYEPGRQTRTFCYVTDATVGFLQALAKGKPGEAYNIGSPAPEVSVLEVAEAMGRAAMRRPVIQVVPHPDTYPADEPQRRCPDIRKALADFGFNPIVPLAKGLRRFLSWTEKEYGQGTRVGEEDSDSVAPVRGSRGTRKVRPFVPSRASG